LHGRLDLPDLVPLYDEFSELPLVSISSSQRAALPRACWVGTVHHGLPLGLYAPGDGGSYLAFVGRVSPDKGLDRAIEIATRAGRSIVVAAKIDHADRDYFDRVLRPLLARPNVEFLGEIGETAKARLMRGAHALLFPIDWPEPFGMVMIESLACATPVVAYPRGAVPEVLEHGVTGFLVDSIDEAVAAVDRVSTLSRRAVRERFEQRFSSTRMAHNYIDIYREILNRDARDRSREPGFRHPGNELTDG
jgi:glycosyltransferase involved in cell wall biosynthesis